MKKKIFIAVPVLALCVAMAFFAFLSLERGGGEIGFSATILSVDGNMITAAVTDDEGTSFFSKKLPDKIVFDAAISGETNFEVGDKIYGNYLKGTIDGENVCVVCFEKIANSMP